MHEHQHEILGRLESRVAALPILPEVVVNLLRLDPADNQYFEQVFSYISGDPGFATRLLQFANSAFFGPPRAVTTLSEAMLRVGAKEAANLVLAHSAATIFLPRTDWQRNLWVHAILVAKVMSKLAVWVVPQGLDGEKAYLFGLLHDIGRFVLYLEAPEHLRLIDETEWDCPDALVKAETEVCGFTHAELGYLALEKWGLPWELSLAVRYHHTVPFPPVDFPASYLPLNYLLQDADRIAIAASRKGSEYCKSPSQDFLVQLREHLRSRYSLSLGKIADEISHAIDESEALIRLLKI